MAFNGSGTFNRVYNWVTDKANAIKITASRVDTEMDGFATGLSTCITKDGQTTITADLPMSTFKHTGVGNASARTHYAAAGQIQDEALVFVAASGVGGTGNAITLTPTPAITAMVAGNRFCFLAEATNTAATTIAVSGLTATDVRINGAALVGGEIVSGRLYEVRYDGTYWNLSAIGAGIYQGTHEFWLPAAGFTPRTTNGASPSTSESTTNDVMTKTLDFDQTTSEGAQAQIVFPKSWDEGTITFVPYWTASSGSGGVVWALRGVALSNDDAIDTAYGTEQTSTDTLIATGDIHVGPESSAITIAGTPAAGDWVSLEIKRNTSDGSDTLNADAKLLGVLVRCKINGANDA